MLGAPEKVAYNFKTLENYDTGKNTFCQKNEP